MYWSEPTTWSRLDSRSTPKRANLAAIEMFPETNVDPCEVYFSDYRKVGDYLLPHRMVVRYGDTIFAELQVEKYELKTASDEAEPPTEMRAIIAVSAHHRVTRSPTDPEELHHRVSSETYITGGRLAVILPGAAGRLRGAAAGPGSFAEAIATVLPRIVKIYGSGGLKGLEAYQSGFLISAEGHVLTAWSYVLDAEEYINVVLDDGTRATAPR